MSKRNRAIDDPDERAALVFIIVVFAIMSATLVTYMIFWYGK